MVKVMKDRSLAILAIAFVVFVCAGLAAAYAFSGNNSMKVFDDRNNTQTITIKNGETFKVQLNENPTTGYNWTINVTPGLTIVSDQLHSTFGRPRGRRRPARVAGQGHGHRRPAAHRHLQALLGADFRQRDHLQPQHQDRLSIFPQAIVNTMGALQRPRSFLMATRPRTVARIYLVTGTAGASVTCFFSSRYLIVT